jgi:hypothetical protein
MMTDAGAEAVQLRAENEQLRADNERMRQALDTTVRAFRTVDAERAALSQQLAALTVTVDGKTQPLIRRRIMLSSEPGINSGATGTWPRTLHRGLTRAIHHG